MSVNTNEKQIALKTLDQGVIEGDFTSWDNLKRITFVKELCQRLGLNELTQPFGFIQVKDRDQKVTTKLYAKKDATEQLRKIYDISIIDMTEEERNNQYIVTVKASAPDGRTDVDKGVVSLTTFKGDKLNGDMLSNAIMKAVTKAKRRVTLSICGLGVLDESEIETIPGAYPLKDVTPVPKQIEDLPGPKSLYEGAQVSIEPIRIQDNKQAFVLKARTNLTNAATLDSLKKVYEEIKQDEKFKDVEIKKIINKHVAECKAKIQHLDNA